MANEPILLIMAAGMGSRYGGLKQMDPVGPAGETILDYSIFDAKRAGFRRVIFLIKHEMEELFREKVGSRIEKHLEVRYAFQQLEKLPEGYAVPEGRVKPWGTGHAVLCCRELVDAPFCVINADDYYGMEAFRLAYDFLSRAVDTDPQRYMMVGYELKNTVTENGYVARGVCAVDENGLLTDVTERTHIIDTVDGQLYTEDGATYHKLPDDTRVSMNMWGFTEGFMAELAGAFPAFLNGAAKQNPVKAEFFVPSVVSGMIHSGKAAVQVLPTSDKWHGVTYREDRASVVEAIGGMTADGVYPSPLWA